MKTKAWKRIGALVLALVLIVSGVPQMCIEALADDTGMNEFRFTELGEGTEIYGGSEWRVRIKYSGNFNVGGKIGTSGAQITWLTCLLDDGEKIESKSSYSLQFCQETAATQDATIIIRIPGSMVPVDGTANVKFTIKSVTGTANGIKNKLTEDLVLYFKGYGVSLNEPLPEADIDGIYVKEVANSAYNWRNYVQFLLSDEDGYDEGVIATTPEGLVNGDFYLENPNDGIWIGDSWYHGESAKSDTSIEFKKMSDDKWKQGVWRLHPQWYNNSAEIPDGLRMVIEGLFYAGDRYMDVEKSVMEWKVTSGDVNGSNTGTWILLPRLLELAEGTTVQDGEWKIYMNHVGTLDCNDGETFIAKALVGNEEINVTISTDGSHIIITPPADKVPTDGSEVTFVLKAQDITGTAGSTSMIVNDVTFCINEYGLALDEYITVDTEDVALTYYYVSTQPNYVYMRGLIDDVFPATNSAGNLSWDIYPEPLNGIVDGVYYYEGNSGIWVDETYYDKNGNGVGVGFVKHGMTGQPLRDYYLSSAGEEGVEKEIKVQGVFRWTDDNGKTYMVEYLPSSLKWDGTKWTDASTYTVLQKDLDSKTNYADETWNIYMNHNGGFKGNGDDELFKWPATIIGVDGTKTNIEIDVHATPNGDTYYFNPIIKDTAELTPETGKVELIIEAAKIEGNNGTTNELIADVPLYFDKYGLSVEGESTAIEMPTSSIKLGRVSPYSWDTGLYFHTSAADPIKGDDSWDVRPTAMGGYVDGVCYRGQGSISITQPGKEPTKYMPNSKVTGVPSFVKIGNYGSNQLIYYIGINHSESVVKGTQVKIEGLFVWDGKAVDISPTTMEWDGSEWQNITPSHDNVNLTLNTADAILGATQNVYFDSDTVVEEIPVQGWLDPMPGDDNGVFINGIRTGIQLKKESSAQERYVAEVTNSHIELGDELTIKGRFIREGHIIDFNEIVVVFDGSNWNQSVKTTYVTLEDTVEHDSESSFGFTVTPQDALKTDAVNAYTFKEGGIYVNGLYNAAAQLYKLGTNLYKVDLSTCAVTFKQGDTVMVDGTVENSGVKVEYLRSVFTYNGNGAWELTESGIPKEPVRFELDADNSYKADNGDWKLLFKATDGLRGDPGIAADATYGGLMAIINESTEYAPSFFKNSKSYYEVTIPNGSLPSTNGVYEIVIKRGTITGGWEDAAGRYMQKEIVLYVNGDRISDKGTPTESKDVSLTYASGTKSELNLLLNGEDAMIVTTKKGGTIYAENEPNSGVFVNGVKKANLGIYKFEDGSSQYYYVPFSGINYTPVNGDVVVVNGTFSLANYFVTFNTVAMKWDGSSWSAISDLGSITLNDVTCDASDSAFIIDAERTTVDGVIVESGEVLYKEGTYNLVYSIGSAKMSQTLKITYEFTSATNNGAGKADTVLPDMVTGETNASGQFITDVKATTHGTTVISVDKDNTYKTTADFDDYGLDYVIDINIDDDREFKVLQLSDTQTIDSEQIRPNRALGEVLTAQSVPEKQYENWQYYVEKVVAKSKPDVILIAGDIIYTEFDDNGTLWMDLIAYMDSLQIPWAPIFGNHDNESAKGVEWQCEQLMNSTYCLFNQRHEGVGGNGNYSIGLARNGQLEKAIYMLDSNGCGNVAKSGNTYSTLGYDNAGNMTQIRAASGFYQTQIDWYGTTAKRVNAVAGKVIPSIQCYHIGTEEVLLAARAAAYQYGEENAALKYGMENDPELDSYYTPCHDLFTNQDYSINYSVKPQTGDSGYKMGEFSDLHRANGMLELMNEVGTTGVFLGHNHSINTSMTYGGVRWTYGLKTGMFANDTTNKGGTLIEMDLDGTGFEVEQIQVELEYSEPTLDGDKASENTESVIYINGNAIRDAIPNNTLKVANDAECGIFVNTVKVDASIEKYDADKYKITLPNAVKAGDVITVYGIFENETASHAVYFRKTLAIKWDGTMWNAISVNTINGTTVNVNSVGVDCDQYTTYNLPEGTLPLQIAEDGTKTSVKSVEGYGDNVVQSKLDNILYKQIIAFYIPGDSHTDEKIDVLDLVAMKKAENGDEPTTETEKYADQLGSKGLREKMVGK